MKLRDRLPASFRILDSCGNCAHVFQAWDEGAVGYYCTLNAPVRPMCMCVSMDGEWPLSANGKRLWPGQDATADEAEKVWEEWSAGRSTEQNGICDCWRRCDDRRKTD